VERRNIAGAVVHGVGTNVNVGLGVYNWGGDMKKDYINEKSNVMEKIADSSIDTATDIQEFLVDKAIADAEFAFAGDVWGFNCCWFGCCLCK
jgi:hypothetical protein